MKRNIFCALCLLLFNITLFAETKDNPLKYQVKKITVLEVNASINPATFNYLNDNLRKLNSDNKDLAVIKLNTPGGLVSTTKEIITLIGSVDYPIAVWVTPEGASATSAGAIIASSAHILVMSDGTNIGAATPINLGKDIEQKDAKAKAVNDLVALVRSLSKARGRSPGEFEKMISEAKSLDAREALNSNVIDQIIDSNLEFKRYLKSLPLTIKGKHILVEADKEVDLKVIQMDAGQQILNIFANPTTAYILFIIGAALIYFELQAPGGIIAGGIGALCLVLAGIGFQVLPLNVGAMGLIVLSFALFIVEVYVTSFGVLTIAGLASLVFGSLFLFRTDNSLIELEQGVVFSVAGSVAVYVIFIGWFLLKTYKNHKSLFSQSNETGVVSNVLENGLYQIKINGEIWKATSEQQFSINEKVEVIKENEESLILKIKKII